MGNYTSCANLSSLHHHHHSNGNHTSKSAASATVILPGAQIQQFYHPLKAAHLMLDYPAYFLSDSHSLNIGSRFSPLPADHDLEMGNLYVMIPMRRLNSIVTSHDLMPLNTTTTTTTTTTSNLDLNLDLELEEKMCESERLGKMMEYSHSYKCRVSRKPALDTITEEPSFFIFLT